MHGTCPPFNEEDRYRHSFDLTLFPRYLERVPPRVRIVVSKRQLQHPSLLGLYEQEDEATSSQVAFLLADPQGVETDSDAFYGAVHAAFAAQAGAGRYVGFTRHGRPPYAPLFALALLYKKYGRGLYLDGDFLPTPWPALTFSYGMRPG